MDAKTLINHFKMPHIHDCNGIYARFHAWGQFAVPKFERSLVGAACQRIFKGQTFQLHPVGMIKPVYGIQEQKEDHNQDAYDKKGLQDIPSSAS